jgi:hypothetical protein
MINISYNYYSTDVGKMGVGNCVVDKWGDGSADNCIWEQSPLVVAHKFWEHGNNIC